MAQIIISIIDQTGGVKTTVEMPDDVRLSTLIPALVNALELPTKQGRNSIIYHLVKIDGIQLDEGKTLAENGLESNAVLSLLPEVKPQKDKSRKEETSKKDVTLSPETIESLADLIAKKVESNLLVTVREVEELTKADKKLSHGTILIHPSFGIPSENKQYQNDVFMIMPFKDEFESIYRHFIVKIVQSLNLSIKRGDDFFSARNTSIIDKVWSTIYFSKFVIADCTGRNPNVFYEIGIAHVLGKPTILITQNIDDVPFDVQNRRLITYQNNAAGLLELETKLNKNIQILLNEESSNNG
jgi:hypothetical protein